MPAADRFVRIDTPPAPRPSAPVPPAMFSTSLGDMAVQSAQLEILQSAVTAAVPAAISVTAQEQPLPVRQLHPPGRTPSPTHTRRRMVGCRARLRLRGSRGSGGRIIHGPTWSTQMSARSPQPVRRQRWSRRRHRRTSPSSDSSGLTGGLQPSMGLFGTPAK